MISELIDSASCHSRMIGRYISEEYEEVELSGNVEALKALAMSLSSCTSLESIPLDTPNNIMLKPYTHFLTDLRIQLKGDRVSIYVKNNSLDIEGSKPHLTILAQQIADMVSDASVLQSSVKPHIHIEYYADHPYLDGDSLPFIIVMDIPDVP